jgi:hypothetical protein
MDGLENGTTTLETVLENSLFLKSKTFTSHSNPVFTQKK